MATPSKRTGKQTGFGIVSRVCKCRWRVASRDLCGLYEGRKVSRELEHSMSDAKRNQS